MFWKEVYYVKDYKKADTQEIDMVLNAGQSFSDWSSVDAKTGKITVGSNVRFSLTDNLYTKVKFKQNGSDSSPITFNRDSDGFFTIPKGATFYAGEISFGFDHVYKNKNENIEVPVNFMEEKKVETNKKTQEVNWNSLSKNFATHSYNVDAFDYSIPQYCINENSLFARGFVYTDSSKNMQYNVQEGFHFNTPIRIMANRSLGYRPKNFCFDSVPNILYSNLEVQYSNSAKYDSSYYPYIQITRQGRTVTVKTWMENEDPQGEVYPFNESEFVLQSEKSKLILYYLETTGSSTSIPAPSINFSGVYPDISLEGNVTDNLVIQLACDEYFFQLENGYTSIISNEGIAVTDKTLKQIEKMNIQDYKVFRDKIFEYEMKDKSERKNTEKIETQKYQPNGVATYWNYTVDIKTTSEAGVDVNQYIPTFWDTFNPEISIKEPQTTIALGKSNLNHVTDYITTTHETHLKLNKGHIKSNSISSSQGQIKKTVKSNTISLIDREAEWILNYKNLFSMWDNTRTGDFILIEFA